MKRTLPLGKLQWMFLNYLDPTKTFRTKVVVIAKSDIFNENIVLTE